MPPFRLINFPVKPARFQRLDRFRTAHPAFAMNDRVHFRVDFIHPSDNVIQRNQSRSGYAAISNSCGFAHVNDLNVVPA